MDIDVITLFPEGFESYFGSSIMRRARLKEKIRIHLHNLRDYTEDKHRRVDDYPYGGDAGMVLMVEPIYRCIKALQEQHPYDRVIYFSPDAPKLNQSMCNELSLSKRLLLLCGHYKGVDQRVRDQLITQEISVGDYVLSGGELPAMILCDALARLLPGVLGDVSSALTDSFQDGLLSPPVYTRPKTFKGWSVPEVLLSGHRKKIEDWQSETALERTRKYRPELLDDK